MDRLVVLLPAAVLAQLRRVAKREKRQPHTVARELITEGLYALGLLDARATPDTTVGRRRIPRSPDAEAPSVAGAAVERPLEALRTPVDYRTRTDRRHAAEPGQAPPPGALAPRRDDDELVTVWTPHRDAPSLIGDLSEGRSVIRGSSLTLPVLSRGRRG